MSPIPTVSGRNEEWFSAVRANETNRVKDLLNRGFHPDTLDEENWSALHTAAWNGFEEICQVLINAHCDLNISGQDGSTPLTLASQKGHIGVVEKLIESGCDVQKSAHIGDCHDVTALHLAAQYGHRAVVAMLIRARAVVGATMSVRGVTGVTPLHLAVQAGHLDVIEVLLEAGVDVNISTRPATESDV